MKIIYDKKESKLPYSIHLPYDDAVIKEYLNSIYSTIVLKDVIKRKKIRNADFLVDKNIYEAIEHVYIRDFLSGMPAKSIIL